MTKPAAVVERRLRVAGCDTRILEVDGSGPTLVLVHGFGDSADTWRPILARAAAGGRRAVAVDLPGFGRATAPSGLVLPSFTSVVRSVAEQSGDGVVLVGHSMGGLTVLQAAIEDDGLLAGVVPVATAGLHHPRWIAVAGSWPVEAVARLLPPPSVRKAALMSARVLAVQQVTSEVKDGLPLLSAHLGGRRVADHLGILRRLRHEVEVPLDLARVRCPALFVWGGRDAAAAFFLNRKRLLALAARVPQARSVVIDASGHTPQLETPDALYAHLDRFVCELPLESPARRRLTS